MIEKFYLDRRASTSKQGTVSITPRQLEALVRLSEASARVRLSDRVDEQDVERAERLMESFLNQTTVVNGIPDVDIILTGFAQKDRKAAFSLTDIIRRLMEASPNRWASLKDIIEEARSAGVDQSQVERTLEMMNKKGTIIKGNNDQSFRIVG